MIVSAFIGFIGALKKLPVSLLTATWNLTETEVNFTPTESDDRE